LISVAICSMTIYDLVLVFYYLESYVLLNVMSSIFSCLMMHQLCGLPDIEDFAYKKTIGSPSSSKSPFINSQLSHSQPFIKLNINHQVEKIAKEPDYFLN